MKAANIKDDTCMVRLDPKKMNQLRTAKGLSRNDFCLEAELSQRTVRKVFAGEPVRIDCAKRALRVFGVDGLEGMLFDSDGAADAQSELGEWTVDKALSPWITASNGLQYRIHRVQHCFLADTWGRGKCYDLAHLSDAERLSRREHLLRHPQVCRRLQPHPHLPVNERVFPAENEIRWWVIDQWVPGRTLAEALEAGPLPTKMAARVLREIAIALKALHDVKIVRRELSPHYVILREKDGSVLLTDLELCKLLDGSPTVSKAWPADPYRAPEAGPEGVDETADLYSWGKILIHAVLGELPEKGCDGSALRQMNLPKPVENLVRRCVAESRRDRPSRVDEILKVMASWQ